MHTVRLTEALQSRIAATISLQDRLAAAVTAIPSSPPRRPPRSSSTHHLVVPFLTLLAPRSGDLLLRLPRPGSAHGCVLRAYSPLVGAPTVHAGGRLDMIRLGRCGCVVGHARRRPLLSSFPAKSGCCCAPSGVFIRDLRVCFFCAASGSPPVQKLGLSQSEDSS